MFDRSLPLLILWLFDLNKGSMQNKFSVKVGILAQGGGGRGLYYSLLEYNHTYKKLLHFIKNSSIL